jgi:phosphatidylinositol-3-phosphatase
MDRLTSWLCRPIVCAAALLAVSAPVAAQARGRPGDDHGRDHVVRAALPPGAVGHIFVLELENEGESTTFGPGSPANFLNNVLLRQGELVEHYYATGHASLDNYIAQISGQAPTEETSADCLTATTNLNTLIGSYVDLLPGTLDPNQQLYPGQVDGHGCIYPAAVPTIANQLDRVDPPNRFTHVAAWRDYDEDMGNQPTGRELGATDPLGGLDCAHPPLNGADNTNAASPATATAAADQYATRHNGFVYFHSILDNAAECDANVVPLGRVQVGTPSRFAGVRLPDTFSGHLADDLKHVWSTPSFGWITPNLCNDGHDSTCAGPNTIGETGAGAGGLHGADEFLAHWVPLLEASPAYRSGQMLIVVTFDEAGSGDGSSCCGETPGPDNPTPGFSPLLAPIFQQLGLPIPNPATGGGQTGAVLLDPRFIEPGSVDTTGQYNHYSALRSYEDLLGLTRGGTDGLGHLGFAAAPGLQPFGRDVFKRSLFFWPSSY